MKKILAGTIVFLVTLGCKDKIGSGMTQITPTFHESEQEYFKTIKYADSAVASYEYEYTSNWFRSSHRNVLMMNVYIDPQQKLDTKDLNEVKAQLKSSEHKISNLKDYDAIKYAIYQGAEQLDTFQENIE